MFDPDPRNVIDKFKSKSAFEIQCELNKLRTGIDICMINLDGDFNFACVIRAANSFGARNVFYIGRRKYDKRGAVGTYHYTNVHWLGNTVTEAQDKLDRFDYNFVALENNTKYSVELLPDFVWPSNPLIFVGSENCGLEPEILDQMDHIVEIPSFGSVRSLNVAVAGGIALYDYIAKTHKETKK